MRLSIITKCGKVLILVLVIALVVACNRSSGDSSLSGMADDDVVSTIDVVTTTNILKDWVENVGDEAVSVHSLVPSDMDPHAFRPTPRSVQLVEEADIVFLVGSQYEEAWLEKLTSNVISNPGKLVYLAESVELRAYSREYKNDNDGHDGHDDDHDGDKGDGDHQGHSHGATDPHFWHNPIMAISAVERIVSDLSSIDMTKHDYFEANGNAYIEKLNEMHNWVVSQVDRLPKDRRILVTNHESLGYFADRYNFEIIGTIIGGFSSEGSVTPRGLADILDKVADNDVNVIFGELNMSDKIAQTISEDTGVVVERLYSENFSSSGGGVTSYIEMIEVNVQTIVDSLESS